MFIYLSFKIGNPITEEKLQTFFILMVIQLKRIASSNNPSKSMKTLVKIEIKEETKRIKKNLTYFLHILINMKLKIILRMKFPKRFIQEISKEAIYDYLVTSHDITLCTKLFPKM